MMPVNTPKDMQQFVGSIVAFENCDFGELFSFDDSPTVKFGAMSPDIKSYGDKAEKTDGFFYFKNPNYRDFSKYVARLNIQEYRSLKMRVATPYEVNKLKMAVFSGAAQLSCYLEVFWDRLEKGAKQRFEKEIAFILGKQDKESPVSILPNDVMNYITAIRV